MMLESFTREKNNNLCFGLMECEIKAKQREMFKNISGNLIILNPVKSGHLKLFLSPSENYVLDFWKQYLSGSFPIRMLCV